MIGESNGPDRMFSIEGSSGLGLVLLKDGQLYVVPSDGWARPLFDGDIDIHPECIQRFVYVQAIPEEWQEASRAQNIRWVLDEVPLDHFEISSASNSWPGFRVQRRERSAH